MTVRFNHSTGDATSILPPDAGYGAAYEHPSPAEGKLHRRVTITALIGYLPHLVIGFGIVLSVLWTAALFWLALSFTGV